MRRIIVVGALIGAGVALWRVRSVLQKPSEPVDHERQNTPEPWVPAVDGTCPVTHPVKAKVASGIYHLPGSQFYERTRPERCYVDATAAEADGYRPAKVRSTRPVARSTA